MTDPARQSHWNRVYENKAVDAVSWYQVTPEASLLALTRIGASPTSSLIDVGGGASNLVDALLAKGWRDLTVLDIAAAALGAAKSRLGPRASDVEWVVADITEWKPRRKFDVWHDRAVFHFLTGQEQRSAYCEALVQGTAAGSRVIIATFALDGPETCSGLTVRRYDTAGLQRELGGMFQRVDDWREEHVTPWGAAQSFTWCAFRRIG